MKILAMIAGIAGCLLGVVSLIGAIQTAYDFIRIMEFGGSSAAAYAYWIFTSILTGVFFTLLGVFLIRLSKRFDEEDVS